MYALLRRLDVSVEIYSINEVVMSDHYIAFPSKGVVYILRSIIVYVICTVFLLGFLLNYSRHVYMYNKLEGAHTHVCVDGYWRLLACYCTI